MISSEKKAEIVAKYGKDAIGGRRAADITSA